MPSPKPDEPEPSLERQNIRRLQVIVSEALEAWDRKRHLPSLDPSVYLSIAVEAIKALQRYEGRGGPPPGTYGSGAVVIAPKPGPHITGSGYHQG